MLRVFWRSRTGKLAALGVGAFVMVAIAAPFLLGDRATEGDVFNAYAPPSMAYPLGTDGLGRGLLARVLVATRLSLGLAAASVMISAGLGITLGALAAQLKPRLRTVVLRAIDMMIAFPGLILAIYVGTVTGPGLLGPVLGVGLAGAFNYARLTSTMAMAINGREYIQAARVTGVRGGRLLFRYVLPNASETLIVATTVSITTSIVALSGLSFLGLGVQPPAFDWGRLLTDGVNQIYLIPTAAVGPAVAIALSALTFGFFGEAMARASNPLIAEKSKRSDPLPPPEPLVDPEVEPLPSLNGDRAPCAELADVERVPATTGGPLDPDLLLEVRDLRVAFPAPGGEVELVCGLSFSMRRGERLGLVGESGSGKTMTAMALAGLTSYPGRVTGTIAIQGKEVSTLSASDRASFLAEELAVIFQDPMSSLNPALKVGTQLTEGVEQHKGIAHAQAMTMARDRLTEVRMATPERQLSRHPHELSGGMRQRTLIAMGLMSEPDLLIADEPTTALDVTIQAQIMDLLDDVRAERGAGMILISHNLALVRQNTDRTLVMYAGRIVEDLPSSDLTSGRHPYTRALLGAVPDIASDPDQQLADIPGQIPDPQTRPSGCAFHPRCPLAMPLCSEEIPPLRVVGDGDRVACWAVTEDDR